MRERFEQGEIDIDPDDDRLAAKFGSIKWGIDSRGRIKIESKGDQTFDVAQKGLQPSRESGVAGRCCDINVASQGGEGITGNLITKAW